MKNKPTKKLFRTKKRFVTAGACLGVIVGGSLGAQAQTNTLSDSDKIDQLASQNQLLQQRLDSLEAEVQKEGLAPSGSMATNVVSAMQQMTLSGFVQTSYFYNLNHPNGGYSAGYLWNTKDNSFSINKIKLTIASPALDPEKWDAGYRVSLMFGNDAPVLNSNPTGNTGDNDVREAYVDLNVPIGTGLDIKAGELISLLNYESGDGGAANRNFSQGYQWYYTGNGPSTGVQLGYSFTDWMNIKIRVDNGLYSGPVSQTNEKGVMGSIGFTPTSKSWLTLIGFGGAGTATEDVDGGSALAGYQFTDKLGTASEFDYFYFDPDGGSSSHLWSIGGWVWYDFTSKLGAAFRAEYLDDLDGQDIKGVAVNGPAEFTAIGFDSPENNGNIASFTFTLDLKPVPNLIIQPEVRYNTTSYAGGYNGKDYQVILGCGASYVF